MTKMTETETQLPATVELATTPEIATKEGLNAVTYLMKVLDNKPNKVMINGKRHIEFDDWVLLGNFYGIDVQTGDAEPVEVFGVKGFKAKARVIKIENGLTIGGAEAYCMSNEKNWVNKPLFQLASMAQTRAGSKALANALRGFVALKGISGTPAEEMVGMNGRKPAPTKAKPKPAKSKKPAPTTPKDIDLNTIVDAEVETHDMTVHDEVNLKTLKGINKELDKWINLLEDTPTTKRQILEACQELLGEQKLELKEFREIKKAMGIPIK